jgi:ribonuclease P protein component
VRRHVGPLIVWACPNELDHPRLGLAIGRRVGGAVTRNRIKRRVREAFRLTQHQWPRGYDVVVSAEAHEAMTAGAYRDLMDRITTELDAAWRRRNERPSASGNEP